MAHTQRTSRDWLSDSAKTHPLYAAFRRDQGTANQMLRASQAAYHLADQAARGQPPGQLLAALFRDGAVPFDVAERYRPADTATVGLLLRDMREVDRRLQDAVIIYYVGAFERFLSNWCRDAEIRPARDTSHRRILENMLRDVSKKGDRWSINLKGAADAFPEIKDRLTASFPTHRPLANVPPAWDCFTVTEMWREVRNLVVHHDRVLHQSFIAKVGPHWTGYRSSFQAKPAKLTAGHKLPLGYRDVVYCFTHVRRSVDELMGLLCDG